MRTLIFILSIAFLTSCGGSKQYTDQVQKLDSLLNEIKESEKVFLELPHADINSRLDSIQSTLAFVKATIGEEITFEDGLHLDKYRSTKNIVKRFGERTTQMKVEFKRTEAQLRNFKEALNEGATNDKNGEEITDQYVDENMKLETTAAENLIKSVNELNERSIRFIKENEERLNELSPFLEQLKKNS